MLYLFDSIKREKKLIILLLYQYVQVILKLFYHMYLHIQIYCKPTFFARKFHEVQESLMVVNISCREPAPVVWL